MLKLNVKTNDEDIVIVHVISDKSIPQSNLSISIMLITEKITEKTNVINMPFLLINSLKFIFNH